MSLPSRQGTSAPTLTFVGMADGELSGGIAIGGENVQVQGPTHQPVEMIGLKKGKVTGGKVVGGANIVLGPSTVEGSTEGADGELLTFGGNNTAVIMVAGAGHRKDIFKKELQRMKAFLVGPHVEIDDSRIFEVIQRPKKRTKAAIQQAIEDVIAELEGIQNAHFIFYYSGHFRRNHTFCVDEKGNSNDDDYGDEDLRKELSKIPAKYVLFILDMCYSSTANVGAQDDDDSKDDVDEEEPAPTPRLWEVPDNVIEAQSGDDDGSSSEPTPVVQKIVQWSSSGNTKTYFHKIEEFCFFTNAILEVITHPEAGKDIRYDRSSHHPYVSVRHLNKHVTQHVQNALKEHKAIQTPVINPPHANEEYFQQYPFFAKLHDL